MTPTYQKQFEAWKVKAYKYEAIRKEFRCGFISTKQFLDARTEFEIAQGEFDLAMAMEAKNNPQQ